MAKQIKVKQGPCLWSSGWGSHGGYFPTINQARAAGAGDPGVDTRVLNARTRKTVKPKVPHLKTVIIIGGKKKDQPSSDKTIIISVNSRLNFLTHSDIHFQLDWNLESSQLFSKTDILVVPTFLKRDEKYVNVEKFLHEIRFKGPIFKIQLDAGPQEANIEKIHGTDVNDIARQWMFNRGYRSFV